jgi:hypothetical protein
MYKRFVPPLIALAAVLVPFVLGTSIANAQSGHLKAFVPFDFVAGTTAMKAGVYFVSRDAGTATFVSVRNSKLVPLAVLSNLPLPSSSRSDTPSTLVFERYGPHYFLREVWFESNAGRALPQTSGERIIAEEYRVASQRERVLITALQ